MADHGPRVKNKSVAPVQITSEQLLRESFERREVGVQAPKHKIVDQEELNEYRGRTRKQFEDRIRRNNLNPNNYIKYAVWELEQKEAARARSIFERGIAANPAQVPVWIRYIESEMRHRNINHARNLCDRAVTVMPRVDKFWYKYVYMEETLGNVEGTRQVFERWMSWEPEEQAWVAYVKFETRYQEIDRARRVFERFTVVHPQPRNWVRWTKFEEDEGDADTVREVFTLAIDTLGDQFVDEKIYVSFARFEAKLKEFERARAIYRYAIGRLPRAQTEQLQREYTNFEKQFGDKDGVELVVADRRRAKYEDELEIDPQDYDSWFDYARMEESMGEPAKVATVYERAVAQAPKSSLKDDWRRYIYLWLYYALYQETERDDSSAARDIYKKALAVVPHKTFTFAKLWVAYAHFEIRQGNLIAARKALGQAIGKCPKDGLFKRYIDLELQLKEFDRCRTLYQKWLEFNPASTTAWTRCATLETELGDDDRARAVYELGVDIPILDTPELLWKSYIDFEYEGEEYANARKLYERLLAKTKHVKVWIAFARFELSVPAEPGANSEVANDDNAARCRNVFQRGAEYFSKCAAGRADRLSVRAQTIEDEELEAEKEQRAHLLETWQTFEAEYGDEAQRKTVAELQPRQVKRRRQLENGTFEEYYDRFFPQPEDAKSKNLLSILATARAWKEKQQRDAGGQNQDPSETRPGLVNYDDDNDSEEDERPAFARRSGSQDNDDDDDDDDEPW